MLAMEDAAKKFEQEKDIHLIVRGKMNCDCGADTLLSLSSIFSYDRNECIQDLQVCKN